MSKYKVGDKIVVTHIREPDDSDYFNIGDTAILKHKEGGTVWLADFSDNEIIHDDGLWYIPEDLFEKYAETKEKYTETKTRESHHLLTFTVNSEQTWDVICKREKQLRDLVESWADEDLHKPTLTTSYKSARR